MQSHEFSQMLSDAIYLIKACEGKTIAIIQDELGYAMGRNGKSVIEYWRKGHLPPTIADQEQLARLLITRTQGRLNQMWLQSFLVSAAHPDPERLCRELFDGVETAVSTPERPIRVKDTPDYYHQPVPQQRLPRAERFTGRIEDLSWLMQALQPEAQVSLIGPGGMGKTALAAEALAELDAQGSLTQRFPDGVIVYSFYSQPDQSLARIHLVRSFNEYADDFSADAVRRLLAQKQALLVFDGAEEAESLDALLDLRGRCATLMTSRRRSDARGVQYQVHPLSVRNAVVLLQNWPGVTITETDATTICKQVGLLPLAVQLTARYLAQTGETAQEYLAWLQTTPIKALSHGRHRQESVGVLLQHSITQLSVNAQTVLGLIGLLGAAPFPATLLIDSLQVAPRITRTALGQLVNYGLLRRDVDFYQVNHVLVYSYAQQHLLPGPAAQATVANVVLQQVKLLDLSRSPRLVLPWLPHLRYCAHQEQRRHTELGAHLCEILGQSLYWLGNYEDAQQYHRWALSIREHLLGITHPQVANSLNHLGETLREMGEYQAALSYLEQAVTIREGALGDNHPETASSLNSLGTLLRIMGEYEKAQSCHERALVINKTVLGENHRETARNLNNLGVLLSRVGKYTNARSCYEQALIINKAVLGENHRETASSLNNLGMVLLATGEYERAQSYLEQALVINRAVLGESHPETAHNLNNLGIVLDRIGAYERAEACYKRALSISKEVLGLKHPGTVKISNNLGWLLQEIGNYTGAQLYYEQSLAIVRGIGDVNHESSLLNNLGLLAAQLGDYETATNYYQQSLILSRKMGRRESESYTLNNLGTTLHALGNYQEAEQMLQQALQLKREIASPWSVAYTLVKLGHLRFDQEDWEMAAAYYEEGAAILRMQEFMPILVECVVGQAAVAQVQGDEVQALTLLDEMWPQIQAGFTSSGDRDLFRVVWLCVRILTAQHDVRAQSLLVDGYQALQARAAKISDETRRRLFLEDTAVHQKLIKLYTALG